ncbi:MAG: flavodoxin family protein [Desulfobacteraceae bacterium]|jgi:multimeric flavodoxin WrbA
MKVLLVNGSPNKSGCTNTALEEVANTLNNEGIETEIYWIGNKPVSGCIACRKCAEKGKCVIDDIVNCFVEKAETWPGFKMQGSRRKSRCTASPAGRFYAH